jgi:hypothetical protein
MKMEIIRFRIVWYLVLSYTDTSQNNVPVQFLWQNETRTVISNVFEVVAYLQSSSSKNIQAQMQSEHSELLWNGEDSVAE